MPEAGFISAPETVKVEFWAPRTRMTASSVFQTEPLSRVTCDAP